MTNLRYSLICCYPSAFIEFGSAPALRPTPDGVQQPIGAVRTIIRFVDVRGRRYLGAPGVGVITAVTDGRSRKEEGKGGSHDKLRVIPPATLVHCRTVAGENLAMGE